MRNICLFLFLLLPQLSAQKFSLDRVELRVVITRFNRCAELYNQHGLERFLSENCAVLEQNEKQLFRGVAKLCSLHFDLGHFIFADKNPQLVTALQDLLDQKIVLAQGQNLQLFQQNFTVNHEALVQFLYDQKVLKEKPSRSVALSYLILQQMISKTPTILVRKNMR